MHLRRPDIAVRGYDFVKENWDRWRVGESESFVRDDVLKKARLFLTRDAVDADPRGSVAGAVDASSNLLAWSEKAQTKLFAEVVPKDELRPLLVDLLFGEAPLGERAARFLGATGPRKLDEKRKARINVTVATYLLAMSDPRRYAFAKPNSAFAPAWTILCSTAGDKVDVPAEAARVAAATEFYGELRTLWARERGFTGDLLDVHTVLFLLGSGDEECNWARALRPQDVAALVLESQTAHPEMFDKLEQAGKLVRGRFVDPDAPDRPLCALQLRDYAYGVPGHPLTWVVEHGTRDFISVGLGNASAHGVGRTPAGDWRILKQDGFDEEQAESYFRETIVPRLEELARTARALVDGRPTPEQFESPKLWGYRNIDGKTLGLFLAGLDPDWTWRNYVAVLNSKRLRTIVELLGGRLPQVDTFAKYVAAVRLVADRLNDLPTAPRPTAYAVGEWAFCDPIGRLLVRYAEGNAVEDEDEGADSSEKEQVRGDTTTSDPWDEFVAGLGADLEPIAALLRRRTNVVLYGPPGTGKTWAATQLATAWRRWQEEEDGDPLESTSVEQVTFHPSYGYEDFVEAFRPDPEAPGRFTLQDGLLPRLAERAKAAPSKAFLLFIDEINRGDVGRILGELVTLIERDKRGPLHARRRMISQEPLWLPDNLYVLGTMNTADRSVSLIDVAVRRRFAFVLTPPNPGLLRASRGLVEHVGGVRLSDLLTALNRRLLRAGVLPDRLIGHALVWIEEAESVDAREELAERLRRDVIPLVEEYCFSDRSQVRRVLGALVDGNGLPDESVLGSDASLEAALKAIVADGESVED